MYGDGSLYGGTLSCPGFIVPWARSATPAPARLHATMPNTIDVKPRIWILLTPRAAPRHWQCANRLNVPSGSELPRDPCDDGDRLPRRCGTPRTSAASWN